MIHYLSMLRCQSNDASSQTGFNIANEVIRDAHVLELKNFNQEHDQVYQKNNVLEGCGG